MKIILASKSPARKELLSSLGLKFSVVPAEIDEEKIIDPKPSQRVKKLALLKAKTVLAKLGKNKENLVLITADTMVYLPPGTFIGKPKNLNEAKRILLVLSGTTHWLYTGVCVLVIPRIFLDYEKTRVSFRKLKEKEIEEYVHNTHPLLYAGGYTIEKNTMGASFVKKIKGSRTNVMGLPLNKLKKILKKLKIPKVSRLGHL